MNREERRRHERNARKAHPDGSHAPARPPRADAMSLAFRRGSVFAAGASGVTLQQASSAGLEQPVFCVLFDPERTYAEVPRLRDLMDMQARLGADETARRMQGTMAWRVLNDPDQPLIKVELHLTEPVELSVTFMLIADNYAQLLPALTVPHVFALRPAPTTGDLAGTDLGALLSGAVAMAAPPSKAIASLVADQRHTAAPEPLVIINGADLGDHMADQVRQLEERGATVIDAEHDGEATYNAFLTDGMARVYWTSANHALCRDEFTRLGLQEPDADPEAALPEARGWRLELADDTFELCSRDGDLALSGDLDNEGMRCWAAAAARDGMVAVYYGPTVDIDITGSVCGMVEQIDDHRSPAARSQGATELGLVLEAHDQGRGKGDVPSDSAAHAPRPSWWRRLLGR